MKLRHPALRNESVMSAFGELKLDAEGFLANRDELEATDEELAGLVGFINDEDFPIQQFPLEAVAPAAPTAPEQAPVTAATLTPTEEVVLALLSDKEGSHFNTQGNLDLNNLNTVLNQKGLGRLNRAECNAVVDRVKALNPELTAQLAEEGAAAQPAGEVVQEPAQPTGEDTGAPAGDQTNEGDKVPE